MSGGLRILVVDDDDMQVDLVSRALSYEGHDVAGAMNLKELEARAREHEPQVVLVDMNMPDLTSEEAIAAVRAAAPDAKVVVFSAWEESKLRAHAQKLGADGYISKSVSVTEIGKRLTAVHATGILGPR